MTRRLTFIFLLALALNFIWENLHSYLYSNYKGAPITEFILFRASLWDAAIIILMSFLFFYISFFRKRKGLMILIGIIIAVLIEWYALSTGRWAYNAYMPIIPLLSVGLTPTIQLGFLWYFSQELQERLFKKGSL
jgi:CHASE2 domain-containing sensor protein